jgi:hypothetical protein
VGGADATAGGPGAAGVHAAQAAVIATASHA